MKATLLQQVESHLLKVSLNRIYDEFKKKGLDARIVASIHDSIWVEAAADEGKEARRLMDKITSTAGRPFLELKVDFSD